MTTLAVAQQIDWAERLELTERLLADVARAQKVFGEEYHFGLTGARAFYQALERERDRARQQLRREAGG